MGPITPGLHLLHKPRAATSFSLVRAAKEAALAAARAGGEQAPALCHGGALDPFAEGLLVLLAGPATKLMEELHPIPKRYQAEIAWGRETDTGDPLGRTVFQGETGGLSAPALEAALLPLLGWTAQVPPATSNKRVGGERAWARAHRGEAVQLAPVLVYLHEARFLSHQLPQLSRLALTCRGGYYVRALARDLGRALGCGAHLAALWRTAIGPWSDPGPARVQSLQGAALLPWLRSRELAEEEAIAAELRRPIPLGALAGPSWPLPSGFPGPGAKAGEPPPAIRGLCGGRLRLLLGEAGGALRLRTDLDGGC